MSSICRPDFLATARDGSDRGNGFLGLQDPIRLWDPDSNSLLSWWWRICYGDVLVQGSFSLNCYVSLDPCEGEARFMDVQVSSKGMMMVAAVDDGVRASQFRLGHASSGTSLIRSSHRRPFGRSEVLLGYSLALVHVGSSANSATC